MTWSVGRVLVSGKSGHQNPPHWPLKKPPTILVSGSLLHIFYDDINFIHLENKMKN